MTMKCLPALQEALISRPQRVAKNKKWSQLQKELGIGTISGRAIMFEHQDFMSMKQCWDEVMNGAPIDTNLKASRVEVAKHTSQEKHSKRQVFDGHLRVAASHGVIALAGYGETRLPPGSYLAIEAETDIKVSAYDRIMVIENGAVMEDLGAMMKVLPEEYTRNTLYVYRGHGDSSAKIKKLLSSFNGTLGLFCDYDLAGLQIASSYREGERGIELIVPKEEKDVINYGKPELFENQVGRYKSLEGIGEESPLYVHVRRLSSHRTGMTQEAMLAHGCGLEVKRII